MCWGVDTQAKGKKAEHQRLVWVKEKAQDSIEATSKLKESQGHQLLPDENGPGRCINPVSPLRCTPTLIIGQQYILN